MSGSPMEHGVTALMVAAYQKHPHVVEVLLGAKANVNLQDQSGESAVTYACSKEDLESLQLLVKHGADPNTCTKDGKSPLLIACRKDNIQVAEALLAAGADPNFMAEDGLTTLMLTCTQGNKEMAELLLRFKADPNLQQPQTGFTALMFAVRYGKAEIIKQLITSGARVNLANLAGKTAHDMALANSNQYPKVYALISVVAETTQSYLKPIEIKKLPEELIGQLLKVLVEKLDRDIPHMVSLHQHERQYLATLPRKGLQDVEWTTAEETGAGIWPYSYENILDSQKPHSPASSGTKWDIVPEPPVSPVDQPEQEQLHGDKGYLKGMTVAATTSFTYEGRAKTLDWSNYGLKLHFPDNATECSIHVSASLSGEFCFPQNTKLISGIYAISSSHKFRSPVTVELEHCAANNFSDLCFVRGKCSQKTLPYNFKILDGGEFSLDNHWGKIQLSEFSILGIIRWLTQPSEPPQPSQPDEDYCGRLYYFPTKPNCWNIHFAIVCNLQLHITAVDERYSSQGARLHLDQPLHFEGHTVSLKIPIEGITVNDGWIIKPLMSPTIMKKEVDSFSPGRRIPTCQLRVEWTKSEEPVGATYAVELLGAKEPYTFFSIVCDPHVSNSQSTSFGHNQPPSLQRRDGVDLNVVRSSPQTCSGISTGPWQKQKTPVSSTAEINAKPDLADALTILLPMAREWKNIGVLLKVSKHSLDNIERSHNAVPNECVREMLDVWLVQIDPPPTWKALANAVERFNPAIALEIWEKYNT